ncbi:MAG: 3-phosphoserine/phosphohydroxythreonine transaminase [SAR324 cluster bacterium]|nr:3-phosphoserine/phosphohydroxythreonine transaminase [SAR324 cluster bacterium]
MKICHNFSPGPAKLPDEVICRMKDEMFDYQGKGVAIFEISHRSDLFQHIYEKAITLFQEVLKVPSSHKVLFVHGGAAMQFAMLALNFMVKGRRSAYIDSGLWSTKAINAGLERFPNEIDVIASGKDINYTNLPTYNPAEHSHDYAYLHITSNNTIYGTQYKKFPKLGNAPLAIDMSSDICSYPLDFTNIGICYGGAQKNIGVAGMGFAVVREDFLARPPQTPHTILRYQTYHNHQSMFNTPNTIGIYVLGLVLEWIKSKGGLKAMSLESDKKSQLIYQVIDKHAGFYHSKVAKEVRSKVNITFKLTNQPLEDKFLSFANKNELLFLKGHRVAGGIRISLYNALTLSSAKALADFMDIFATQNS